MPSRTRKAEESASQDASMQDLPASAQATVTEDAEMKDGAEENVEEEEEEEEEVEEQRVKIVRLTGTVILRCWTVSH